MLRRETLAGLVLAAIGDGAWAATRPLEAQPALPGPLERYRGVAVQEIDGRATTLGGLLGPPRAAVVSFWATWCAPCALEGRKLSELRARYPDPRLAIVGINVDSTPDPAKLHQFRQKARMTYTQGLAGQAAYAALAGQARLALPRTFVFDAQGRPVAAFGRFFGGRTLDAIEAAVRSAVG